MNIRLHNGEIFKALLKIKLESGSSEGIWSQRFCWLLKYRFAFKMLEEKYPNYIFLGLSPNLILLLWGRALVTTFLKSFEGDFAACCSSELLTG